jgi:hypothetical protein
VSGRKTRKGNIVKDYPQPKLIKATRTDARFEFILALIPFGICYWSFKWAVISGIFLATLVLIEILRVFRLSTIVSSSIKNEYLSKIP